MNVVITCLFTGAPDPQRGTWLPADMVVLESLLSSLSGCQAVVLHDELKAPVHPDTSFVKIAPVGQVYFQRWASIEEWLLAHPEVDLVWCVDGTDVVMLHEPWGEMAPDTLYIGSEARTNVSSLWLSRHHPSVAGWIDDRELLNGGLLGGDRASVLTFLHDLLDHVPIAIMARDMTDMGVVNTVGRQHVVVTGPPVHTEFRAYDWNNQTAWWAHK